MRPIFEVATARTSAGDLLRQVIAFPTRVLEDVQPPEQETKI